MCERSSNDKIKIYVDNNVGFVWNSEDVLLLRRQHRIVGKLVGALPRAPQQNNQLGLPLQLSPEEVTVIVEKGIAELFKERIPRRASNDEAKAFAEHRHHSYIQQIPLCKREREMDIHRNLSNIAKDRKAKRNRLLEEQKQLGMEVDDAEFEKEIEVKIDEIDIPPIKESSSVVQLFTEDPWIRQNVEEAEWKFPTNSTEYLRFRVFKEFWTQGYFLTQGSKFGGDFLVYPGDPARFHSFFIARCLPHTKTVQILEIAAIERLATSVRKTVVICSLDDADQVCFTSLQWRGIGWKTTG